MSFFEILPAGFFFHQKTKRTKINYKVKKKYKKKKIDKNNEKSSNVQELDFFTVKIDSQNSNGEEEKNNADQISPEEKNIGNIQ